MNKRTGMFVKVEKNPLDSIRLDKDKWLCYPAKVGPLLIHIFFNELFVDLGCSLANLFELAENDDLLRKKPDAIYAFGVSPRSLAHYDSMPTVFHEDKTNDLLVISGDGKGIVMRADSLRECTKKKILKGKKLGSRLSQGEKKDRKRMAQVASVYTVLPHIRTAESIMQSPTEKDENIKQFRPVARNKRVWASVEKESKDVIKESFLEALQRDPKQKRKWVIVVDGQPNQLIAINKIMQELDVKATIVMDFIHVLEYLWSSAWCFFKKGSQDAEKWVAKQSLKILKGKASQVAKGMRIKATKNKVKNRTAVDKCAVYLLKNKKRLAYDKALEQGFPIASGIIEGACRHLINDRLDITGARWGLDGGEAILKLRSIRSSGDFDSYWIFHKQQEKLRNYGQEQISK